MMRSALPRAKKTLINAFIVFHLIAIGFWATQPESYFAKTVNGLLGPYMLWSGLWQGWDMFAPDPRSQQLYLTAEVAYRDGSRTVWEFPRMEKLGYWERYQKERYRKWAHDNVRADSASGLWPPTARYVARLFRNGANPPKSVKLVRHWADIPAFSNMGLGQIDQPPLTWRHFVFFSYEVAPKDLL